jgi:8-oxo-dGTP pyrophosphatase MutT (NUDIX family)
MSNQLRSIGTRVPFNSLTRNDHVLLALRQGTGFADGMWNLPSGKAENSETAITAVIREAHEEIGLRLTEQQLSSPGISLYQRGAGFGTTGWQTPTRPPTQNARAAPGKADLSARHDRETWRPWSTRA